MTIMSFFPVYTLDVCLYCSLLYIIRTYILQAVQSLISGMAYVVVWIYHLVVKLDEIKPDHPTNMCYHLSCLSFNRITFETQKPVWLMNQEQRNKINKWLLLTYIKYIFFQTRNICRKKQRVVWKFLYSLRDTWRWRCQYPQKFPRI